ncbi:thioredoxin family protein [Enterococcus rivorum]|uniref:Uncharacterized protein n=1 Tax=Enterococcus rivorum TaxID=762845 RepID=A0A1E5KX24_9ENTE|nr:thioredoxin family protein [Enterococcus rivorum]MBP2097280.1 thioredoxin-like negative regulator of GroEL [Enterococcus rivorum]OEH82368.1 hypothetical protein BCR26_02755 [Enterococcus rivorum]
MKLSKTFSISTIVVLSTVVIFQCIYFIEKQENHEQELTRLEAELESSYPKIYDSLDSVTYESFTNLVHQGQEELIFYVGRPTCEDCNLFEPKLIKLINSNKLNKKIKYLNVARIRENEKAWANMKKEYSIEYTPTLVKFSNGKLLSKTEWTPEKGLSIPVVQKWLDENMK